MRFAAAIASLCLAGCFYVESINQRPSLDIRQDMVGDVFRGEVVSFTAVTFDPDDHDVNVRWHVYACTDATTFSDCDAESSATGDQRNFELTVPMTRLDGRPTQGIRIVLDGIDDHGATAKPTDQLQLEVKDRSPDLDLQRRSVYQQMGPQFVVGMPIDIFAIYGDGDNEVDDLALVRTILSPTQVPINITEETIAAPAGKKQLHWVLTPQVIGEWTVEVAVTDPSQNETKKAEKMTVVDDRPPCIESVEPQIAVPGPQEIFDERTFQVLAVSDDLDSAPRTPGGSQFGDATFSWSVLGPTGGRQIVSTAKQFPFDPDVYVPGTIVEIRVEIKDRKATPVTCADAEATCSIGANACLQRQTWRVVAR